MSEERRYGEDEIAEILERATAEREAHPVASSGTGLTLNEIKQIGSEVGIEPNRIAEAARAMAVKTEAPVSASFLGAPRAVSRTILIDRAPTDDEWMRVVADLRETFDAKGKLESHGALRSWSNSNLHVHVEPYGDAYRVRMSTRKGQATQLGAMGAAFTFAGLVMAVMILLGLSEASLARAALFAAFGLGQIGWVRATLPGWAETRAEQMEGLAERIPLLLQK